MIFVTVGAQMSFDRMVRAIDAWAPQSGTKVFAQIGPTSWQPQHIAWTRFMNPLEFRGRVQEADLVVAHAGMGSILTALELGKPILVMPRRGHLNETRNDHQMDTARQFLAQGRINVAFDENELCERLNHLDILCDRRLTSKASNTASPELIHALRAFIHSGTVPAALVDQVPASTIEPISTASHDVALEQSVPS